MKLITLLSLFILQFSLSAQAARHIVMFQTSEIFISSMDHAGVQSVLQGANKKNVTQLNEWLESRGVRAAVKDLWIIRGAILDIEASEAKKLEKEPWVSRVFRDRLRKFVNPTSQLKVGNTLSDVTDEPGSLWGLERIGVGRIKTEFPNLDGSGVRVGVLDTGIQSKHPELKQTHVIFKDFVSGLTAPYDDHGHGTHVAGTIAGEKVGIAPKVDLVVAKIFSAGGSGFDSEIISGMQWMFDPDGDPSTNDHPQIVSNSWGGDLTGVEIADIADFGHYQKALDSWIRGGMIPIFAAGNSGAKPNGFPGGLPEVIAVGAIDEANQVAEFSSLGPNLWKMETTLLTVMKPDVSAPGVNIASAFPGNKYASWAGTSMATPHVSGAVALLLQKNKKLGLAGVKEALLKSCEKKESNSFGYGILDAYRLINPVRNIN